MRGIAGKRSVKERARRGGGGQCGKEWDLSAQIGARLCLLCLGPEAPQKAHGAAEHSIGPAVCKVWVSLAEYTGGDLLGGRGAKSAGPP